MFWREQRRPRLSLFRPPTSPSLWKLGNLSTDDGDAKDDAWQKMDLKFTLEFRK